MYGSMAGVYGPYYRGRTPIGMAGMAPHPPQQMGWAYDPYIGSPHMTGMYGSMSGVYSPYYRPPPPGMGGMTGP
jgi:hypothetical protein